jgi:uncharacterized BrkB/YihY/UPF0761 family membrane protein
VTFATRSQRDAAREDLTQEQRLDQDQLAPDTTPAGVDGGPAAGTPSPAGKLGLRDRYKAARSKADETKRTLFERSEKESESHTSVRAALVLFAEDRARGGGLLAGGIAYRLFLWLMPAALAVTSLLSGFATLSGDPPAEVAESFGMGGAFAATIGEAASDADRAAWVLFVMGLVLMLWAGRSVGKACRLVSTLAWDMKLTPADYRMRQTLAIAGLLLAFPILPLLLKPLYSGDLRSDLGASLITVAGIGGLAAVAAAHTPHPDGVRWYEFLPGALIFALGMEAMRVATTVYFTGKLVRVNDLYGAVGLSAVFMTYLYLVARLIVIGYMTNGARWRVRHPGEEQPE